MSKKYLLILMMAVLCPVFIFAGSLRRDHVPATAQWVFHADFDAFRASELGSLVQTSILQNHQQKLDALSTLLGTNPAQDIHAITLYGSLAGEENASVLCYGKFDQKKLLSLLALNESYSKDKYDGITLHYWKDDKSKKNQVGAFAKDGLIVIGQKTSCVASTLDVLSGKNKTLSEQKDARLYSLCNVPQSVFLLAAAEGISNLMQDNQHAAILKNSQILAVLGAENTGQLSVKVHLETESEEAAEQVEQVVRGMTAFAALNQKDHPEFGILIDACKLTRQTNKLDLTFEYPSADLFEIFTRKFGMDIWAASATGNIEAIKVQLATGADANAKEPIEQYTPLFAAAAFGHTEAAKLLIKEGADLNVKNNDGATALHAATFLGHPDTVKLLLEEGADLDATNKDGYTALDIVTAEWDSELEDIYKYMEHLLNTELDLDRIKAVRPEIADLLRNHQ